MAKMCSRLMAQAPMVKSKRISALTLQISSVVSEIVQLHPLSMSIIQGLIVMGPMDIELLSNIFWGALGSFQEKKDTVDRSRKGLPRLFKSICPRFFALFSLHLRYIIAYWRSKTCIHTFIHNIVYGSLNEQVSTKLEAQVEPMLGGDWRNGEFRDDGHVTYRPDWENFGSVKLTSKQLHDKPAGRHWTPPDTPCRVIRLL